MELNFPKVPNDSLADIFIKYDPDLKLKCTNNREE